MLFVTIKIALIDIRKQLDPSPPIPVTLHQGDVVLILVPITVEGPERFWIRLLCAGLLLPPDICPGILVRLAIFAGAKVVAKSWSASTKRTVIGPWGILL